MFLGPLPQASLNRCPVPAPGMDGVVDCFGASPDSGYNLRQPRPRFWQGPCHPSRWLPCIGLRILAFAVQPPLCIYANWSQPPHVKNVHVACSLDGGTSPVAGPPPQSGQLASVAASRTASAARRFVRVRQQQKGQEAGCSGDPEKLSANSRTTDVVWWGRWAFPAEAPHWVLLGLGRHTRLRHPPGSKCTSWNLSSARHVPPLPITTTQVLLHHGGGYSFRLFTAGWVAVFCFRLALGRIIPETTNAPPHSTWEMPGPWFQSISLFPGGVAQQVVLGSTM